MSSDVVLKQIQFLLRETGQPNIGMEDFGFMCIPLAPIVEQTEICKYIESKFLKIEKAVGETIKSIDKLKEYKATLINSAVTGKIDVSTHGY